MTGELACGTVQVYPEHRTEPFVKVKMAYHRRVYPRLVFMVTYLIPLLRVRLAKNVVEALAYAGARSLADKHPDMAFAVVNVHLTHGTTPNVFVFPTLTNQSVKGCGAYIPGQNEILISQSIVEAMENSTDPRKTVRLMAEVFVTLIHELAHYLNHWYGYGKELEDKVKDEWGVDLGVMLTEHLWDYRGCIESELKKMGAEW
jgi:hypothetical protein